MRIGEVARLPEIDALIERAQRVRRWLEEAIALHRDPGRCSASPASR